MRRAGAAAGLAVVVALAVAVSAGFGGTRAAPTGTPIRVMTSAAVNSNFSTYENIVVTAKVYGKWINDHGGINGHPLEVITCDDQNDPNKLVSCGREAVAKKVVAWVGSFTINADKVMPLLERSKIAWFGVCCPVQNSENVSKVSFPTGSGPAITTGQGYWAAQNCKKTAVVIIQVSFLGYLRDLVAAGFKSVGKPMPPVVELPPVAQDYSPQAAQATSGNPDCIVGVVGETQWFAFLPALQQSGWKGTIVGPQGNLDQVVVKRTPAVAQGAVISGAYPDISSAVFADYRAALKRYNAKPTLDYNSLGGLGTWAGYKAFTDVVSRMKGPIDNRTFLAAASKATNVSTGGATPNLDFSKEWTAKGLNRVFNRAATYDTVKNGKLVPLTTKFYDLTAVIQGKPGPRVPGKPTL